MPGMKKSTGAIVMPQGGRRTPEEKVRRLQERLRHSAKQDKQRPKRG
jgi:hypothetical protein